LSAHRVLPHFAFVRAIEGDELRQIVREPRTPHAQGAEVAGRLGRVVAYGVVEVLEGLRRDAEEALDLRRREAGAREDERHRHVEEALPEGRPEQLRELRRRVWVRVAQ